MSCYIKLGLKSRQDYNIPLTKMSVDFVISGRILIASSVMYRSNSRLVMAFFGEQDCRNRLAVASCIHGTNHEKFDNTFLVRRLNFLQKKFCTKISYKTIEISSVSIANFQSFIRISTVIWGNFRKKNGSFSRFFTDISTISTETKN